MANYLCPQGFQNIQDYLVRELPELDDVATVFGDGILELRSTTLNAAQFMVNEVSFPEIYRQ